MFSERLISQASGERPIRLFFHGDNYRHYSSLLPTDVADLIWQEEDAGIYEDKQFELYTKLQHKKKSKAEKKSLISSDNNDAELIKALDESLKLYELENERHLVRLKNKDNLNLAVRLSLLKQ